MRTLRRLIRDERGGPLAEFAIGMIPLILVFAIVFEFGRVFWMHQAVIKGVRDATRYLSRVEDPNSAAAQTVARRLMLTGQQTAGGTERWSSGSAPKMEVVITNVANGGTYRGPPTIRIVNVAANVEIPLPMSGVFALFGGAPAGTVTFSVGDSARHYGQ